MIFYGPMIALSHVRYIYSCVTYMPVLLYMYMLGYITLGGSVECGT